MKKIIAIIPIAIFIILLSTIVNVKADSSHWIIAVQEYDGSYRPYLWNCATNSSLYVDGSSYRLTNCSQVSGISNWYSSIAEALSVAKAKIPNLSSISPNNYSYVDKSSAIIIYSNISTSITGDNIFSSFEDYENSLLPPPEPSWWETLWDEFVNYWNDPELGNWVQALINKIWGDDNEDTIADSVEFTNPTLTPAPTPIPYTTVVIPKTDPVTGDKYYETNYYYNNPSGTPIIQPYPPTNSPSANSPSGGTDYTPVNGDPYSIPLLNWLTSATIGDTDYDGLDSIGEGMTSVDEIGSEYTDGIGAAQDATSVLPNSWLLLIGIAAAIPLLAGIISRFLS